MGKMLYFVTVIGVLLQTINGQDLGMQKLEQCPCANQIIEGFLDSVAKNTLEVDNAQKLRLRLWQLKSDDCATRVIDQSPNPGRIEIGMLFRGSVDILEQGEGDDQYRSDDDREQQGKVDFGQQFGGVDIGSQQGSAGFGQQFGGVDIGSQQGSAGFGQQFGDVDIGSQQGSAGYGHQFGGVDIGPQQGVDIGPQQGSAGFGQQFGDVDIGQQQGAGNGQQQGSADYGQQFGGVDIGSQQGSAGYGHQFGGVDIGPQQGVADIEPQQGSADFGQQFGGVDNGQQQGVADIGPQQGEGNGQQQGAGNGQQQAGLPKDIDIEKLLENLALEQVQQRLEQLQSQVIDTTQEQAGTDTPQEQEGVDDTQEQVGVDDTQEQVGVDAAQKQSELPNGSSSGPGGDSAAFTFTVDVNTGKLTESIDAAPVSKRRKRDLMPFDTVVIKIGIDFDKSSVSDVATRNDQIKSVLRKALADYWLAMAFCLLDVEQ